MIERKGFHRTGWVAFLASGILGLALFALRLGPAAESALFLAYSCTGVIAIFTGIYLSRPRPLAGWLVIGVGQAFSVLGDFAFTRSLYLQDPGIPAGLSEGFYLAGQLCLIIGLGQIFYFYRKLITGNAVAQGAMVAIGLCTLVWVQAVSPNLEKGFGWLEWSRLLVYPVCLLVIFSVAAVFLMTSMGMNWSYRLFFAGGIVYALGLNFYSQIVLLSEPIFASGNVYLAYLADVFYSLAYLLIGTAHLHPDLAAFREDIFEKGTRVSRMELLLLAAAFWIGPVVYTLANLGSIRMDVVVIMASMLIIFGINEWRLARLVRMLESQNKELSQHREMLHHQAFHDALTGLPNRASLYNHLEELIDQIRLRRARGAVFLIDVNNFKQVNDTLGHDEGDRVLKEVSNAFSAMKRKEDVVGRWGGDEFMMVLRNLPDETSAKALARRLQQEIRWTVSGSEGSVVMSISIGICLIPTGNEKLQTIVKKADLALYQAKRMPEIGISLSGW